MGIVHLILCEQLCSQEQHDIQHEVGCSVRSAESSQRTVVFSQLETHLRANPVKLSGQNGQNGFPTT